MGGVEDTGMTAVQLDATNEYGFCEIKALDLPDNPFKLIGRDWMLLTAEKEGKANAMTIAWGGLGEMWGKHVVFVAVRPERYTFEFMEAAPTFSLTVFGAEWRKMLAYFGTVSGRDEDKIAKCKLTLLHEGGVPYFAESRLCFLCKKTMAAVFQPEELVDQKFSKFYGGENAKDGLGGGWHTLYIGEIVKILTKPGAA